MIIGVNGVKVEFAAKDTPQDGQRLLNLLTEYAGDMQIMDKAEEAARTLTLIANSNGVGLGFKVDNTCHTARLLANAISAGVEQADVMATAHAFCDLA